MPAPYCAAFVADRQTPAATQAAALQDRAAVLGRHSIKKAMLSTTWNAFWLPGSLWHDCYTSIPTWCLHHAGIVLHQGSREPTIGGSALHSASNYTKEQSGLSNSDRALRGPATHLRRTSMSRGRAERTGHPHPRLISPKLGRFTRRRPAAGASAGSHRAGGAYCDRRSPLLPLHRSGACDRACRRRRTWKADLRSWHRQ
jgi:hypothetical protein